MTSSACVAYVLAALWTALLLAWAGTSWAGKRDGAVGLCVTLFPEPIALRGSAFRVLGLAYRHRLTDCEVLISDSVRLLWSR